MKLLDLPRSKEGIKIYPDVGGEISDGSTFIRFHHIDGLYSFCVTEKGGYIHLHAMTPIEKHEDGYIMVPGESAD
jgi:hypothetical protein